MNDILLESLINTNYEKLLQARSRHEKIKAFNRIRKLVSYRSQQQVKRMEDKF